MADTNREKIVGRLQDVADSLYESKPLAVFDNTVEKRDSYTPEQLESMVAQADNAATKKERDIKLGSVKGDVSVLLGLANAGMLQGVALGLRMAANPGMGTTVTTVFNEVLAKLDPNAQGVIEKR